MKILLTGASGFIGKHILVALESAGHEVIPATRAQGFDFNRMCSAYDWLPHLRGVDAVINSVGIIVESHTQTFSRLHHQTPEALFQACAQTGVKRVIQISALGADDHAFTPYHMSKKAADDVLRNLPLEWFVLRPSLVYGPGGKSTAMFRRMAALPVIPVVGDGLQRIQPVQVSDLAAAVVTCLSATPARRTIDVVGPAQMTFIDWLLRLRKASGKAAAPTFHIPFNFVLGVSQIAKHMVPLLHPDNLRMLQAGNTADVRDFAELLGRMPHDVP
jgi:uncharacterized protein YbjT (DUF2867 family)